MTAYEVRISDWSSDVCSSDLFCQSALPGRVFAELPREELRERPHPRRYQAPLRHHGVDAAVGDRMVRQHDLQAAGAEVLAHVPGRMPGDAEAGHCRVADNLAEIALEPPLHMDDGLPALAIAQPPGVAAPLAAGQIGRAHV